MVLFAGAATGALSPALAQQQAIGVVTLSEGQATVVRAGQSPVTLRFRDPVFPGAPIEVGPESLLKMLLGGKVLLTADERSAFTITEDVVRATINLVRGKVRVAVNKAGMKPGENFEIRTPNAVVQVRGSLVVVEVQSGTTDVDCVEGRIFVAATGNPFIQCPQNQGFTIAGNILGPLRPIRPNVVASRQHSGAALLSGTTVKPPLDWTLLIDRGSGFEAWVGAHSEGGNVVGDNSYENVTLAACDAVAMVLVEKGARVACARASDPETLLYRSVRPLAAQEHTMATGPLAGRLVVYEPGVRGTEWTLWRDWGRGFTPTKFEGLELTYCEGLAAREFMRAACVRSRQESLQYWDVRGRLMAEGPFAGGMIVYDPVRPPLGGAALPGGHDVRILPAATNPKSGGAPEVKDCPYDDWMSTGCRAGQPLK